MRNIDNVDIRVFKNLAYFFSKIKGGEEISKEIQSSDIFELSGKRKGIIAKIKSLQSDFKKEYFALLAANGGIYTYAMPSKHQTNVKIDNYDFEKEEVFLTCRIFYDGLTFLSQWYHDKIYKEHTFITNDPYQQLYSRGTMYVDAKLPRSIAKIAFVEHDDYSDKIAWYRTVVTVRLTGECASTGDNLMCKEHFKGGYGSSVAAAFSIVAVDVEFLNSKNVNEVLYSYKVPCSFRGGFCYRWK